MRKTLLVPIPLVHALAWIVGSVFVVSGTAHFLLSRYGLRHEVGGDKAAAQLLGRPTRITALIQTGPQKEALRTECLAEWLGLSVDRPAEAASFDLEEAARRLRQCPLISSVELKLLETGAMEQSQDRALYVDYTVRQPIAWLSDYENVVLDREGYPFPFKPFFSPKNLPEIYLGLAPFGQKASEEGKPMARWHQSLMGKHWALALEVLTLLTAPKLQELFTLRWVDVSQAYASSYGRKEVVVMVEDKMMISRTHKESLYLFPKILRLSAKNYAAELGNYLKLREELVRQEHREAVAHFEKSSEPFAYKVKVLDFRIPNLAFIL